MLRKVKNTWIYKKLRDAKNRFKYNKINRSRFRFDKKIIVIESDDWGSIRTSSKKNLEKIVASGDNALSDPFLSYDSLESSSDLLSLFDTLRQIKDSNGRCLPITANFAMANADFDSIAKSGEYKRQCFYDTYRQYFGSIEVLDLIKLGISEGLFMPQLHCLEHLNVISWMNDLKAGKPDVKLAFDNQMYGIGASFDDNKFGYMDAFNYRSVDEQKFLSECLAQAVNIFRDVFGFESKSFTACCYVFDDFIENELNKLGIKHIQCGFNKYLPFYKSKSNSYDVSTIHMCDTNSNSQLYTIRNCSFEPSFNKNAEYTIHQCVEQVKSAFNNNVPAIISIHRLNFISSINSENNVKNLNSLKKLFNIITHDYPDVIFMTSDELGSYINDKFLSGV